MWKEAQNAVTKVAQSPFLAVNIHYKSAQSGNRVHTTGVPREGARGVQTPPLSLQNFFGLCVCKIYCPSSAPILTES